MMDIKQMQDKVELLQTLVEAAMAQNGSVSELRSHINNLEKQLSTFKLNDIGQVAQTAILRKEIAAVNATLVKYGKHLAPKTGTGLTEREYRLVDLVSSGIAAELKKSDEALTAVKDQLTAIAAGFSASLEQMRQLTASSVTAAGHALQTETRSLSSGNRAKALGTANPQGVFARALLGVTK